MTASYVQRLEDGALVELMIEREVETMTRGSVKVTRGEMTKTYFLGAEDMTAVLFPLTDEWVEKVERPDRMIEWMS